MNHRPRLPWIRAGSWPPELRNAMTRFGSDRIARFAALGLLAAVCFLLAFPLFARTGSRTTLPAALRWSPTELTDSQLQPPSWSHWWGTDLHGRDLLSRTIYGARISLLVGCVGAGMSLIVGVLWGAVAGFWGGRLDNFLMRSVDLLYTLPTVVLVLVLITVAEEPVQKFAGTDAAGSRLLLLIAGLGAVSWLTMARIVRGQVLVARSQPYVEASRALGSGPVRLLFRHVLPQVYGVALVYLTLTLPTVILAESFLSYLGLGIQPPQASLGSLIADGAAGLNPIRTCWWLLVFPGGVLGLMLSCLTLLGDALRDAQEVHPPG